MQQRSVRRRRAIGAAVTFAAATAAAHAQDAPTVNPRDLTGGDPFYYTQDQRVADDDGQKALVGVGRPERTHSQIPHLPSLSGYMSTNYTYRFVSVTEQVLTMIGEGKHGLWRVGESGTVREYLRRDAPGLPPGADVMAPKNLAALESDYSSFLPQERFDGYKYPDQATAEDGRMNFVDLPITHPKYKGRYLGHAPINLPSFYCTMSGADYPYARTALDFAFSQPGAGAVGPLGQRAGLDIDENYTKRIRLQHFPDARSWVNVGVPGKDASHVRWAAIDTSRTKAEYYLVERPFFNVPYLFVMAVFDNEDNQDFRYVRPHGPYYEALRQGHPKLNTSVTQAPRFYLTGGGQGQAIGLPLYGVHHPDRAAFKGGGACPLRGGDWGRYPKPGSGAGWPTQYEEVTPLCDAVLIDIKFFANLDGRDWSDPDKYLANAGTGKTTVEYRVQPGRYGEFVDPYNVKAGRKNPDAQEVPERLTLTFPKAEPPVSFVKPPNFGKPSPMMAPSANTSCRPIVSRS